MRKVLLLILAGMLPLLMLDAQARLGNFNQRGAATQEMNDEGFCAAHPSIPINSRVNVLNPENGREIIVTIIGRIPASVNRIIDLSPEAAGVLKINPGDIVALTIIAVPFDSEAESEPSRAEPDINPQAANTDGGNPQTQDNMALFMMMMMEAREAREIREDRAIREAREAREERELRAARESHDMSEAFLETLREEREAREALEARIARDERERAEREQRAAREARNTSDALRETLRKEREAREALEARIAKDERERGEREQRIARETREAFREELNVRETAARAAAAREAAAREASARETTAQEAAAREAAAQEAAARETAAREAAAREVAVREASAREAAAREAAAREASAREAAAREAAAQEAAAREAATRETAVREAAIREAAILEAQAARDAATMRYAVIQEEDPYLSQPDPPAVRPQPLPPSSASAPPVLPLPPSVRSVEMEIIPGLPNPHDGKRYHLQIGAFSAQESAITTAFQVNSLGFEARVEYSSSLYRVVTTVIPSAMVSSAVQRLGILGFRQIFIMEPLNY